MLTLLGSVFRLVPRLWIGVALLALLASVPIESANADDKSDGGGTSSAAPSTGEPVPWYATGEVDQRTAVADASSATNLADDEDANNDGVADDADQTDEAATLLNGGARARDITLAQDSPMAVVQFTGFDLRDLEINPIRKFSAVTDMNSDPKVLFIRGVGQDSSPTQYEPGVLTYVDDVYLPFTTGGIFSLIDTEDVSVRRGPHGTLGGKGSIGAAVRFNTIKPQPEFGAGTNVTFGSLGTLRSETTINVPFNIGRLKERAFGRFSVATRTADGFIENVPTRDQSGDDDLLAGRAALRFLPTDTTEVNISWDKSVQDMALTQGQCRDVQPFTGNRLLLDTFFNFSAECARSSGSLDIDKVFSDKIRQIDLDEQGLNARVDVDLDRAWRFSSISGYRSLDFEIGKGDFDDTQAQIIVADKIKSQRNAFSQEFQLSGRMFDDRLRLQTGVYGFQDSGRVKGGFDKFSSVLNDRDRSLGFTETPNEGLSSQRLSFDQAARRLSQLGADPSKLRRNIVVGRDAKTGGALVVTNIGDVDVFPTLSAFAQANGINLRNGNQPTFGLLDQAFNRVFSERLLGGATQNVSSFDDEFTSRTYAGYLNTDFDLIPERLTISAGLRYTIDKKDEKTRTFPLKKDGAFTAVATAQPPMPNEMGEMSSAEQMAMMADMAGMTDMANMMMVKAAQAKSRDRVSGESPSQTFSELTPSADVTLKVSDNMTLLGHYARGFVSGDARQEDSEILDTYEVGLRTRWFDDRLLLNLSGYYSTYDNIQVDVSVTDEFGQNVKQRLNSASATIRGMDFDFQTSFQTAVGNFDFGGGLGLIDAKYNKFETNVALPLNGGKCKGGIGLADCPLDALASARGELVLLKPDADLKAITEGNNTLIPQDAIAERRGQGTANVPIGQFADNVDALLGNSGAVRKNVDRTDLEFQNTPRFSYNLFLRYQLDMASRGSLTAVTTWYQQGKTFQNFFNTVEQGTYGVMDLSLAWVHPGGKLVLGAFVNNALDRRYINGASDSTDFDGTDSIFFSRPRSYGIQVGYRFGSL